MVYVGIDPGASGGYAALYPDGVIGFHSFADSEAQRWDQMRMLALQDRPFAVIEEIHGSFQGSSKGSVAKLYGSYTALRMAMVGLGIPFVAVGAGVWHRALGIPPRVRASKKHPERTPESTTEWKNRLKAEAAKRFPRLKVTLATADALLIACYCKQVYGNK